MKDATDKSIFSPGLDDDIVTAQRRAGFFALHEINPGAVVGKGARVVRIGKGQCRVIFEQAVLPDGVDQWSAHAPDAVLCYHGGEVHEVSRTESVTVSWIEVRP